MPDKKQILRFLKRLIIKGNLTLAVVLILRKLRRLHKAPRHSRRELMVDVAMMVCWLLSMLDIYIAPFCDFAVLLYEWKCMDDE